MSNDKKIVDYFRNFDILNPATVRAGSVRLIDFGLGASNATETVYDLNEIECRMKRLLESKAAGANATPISSNRYDTYVEEEYFDWNSDDDEESVLKVVPRFDGQFEIKANVSDYYYPYLIGRKGSNLRQLQEKCNAKIRIPCDNKCGSVSEPIEIIGKSERVVLTAKRILDLEIAAIHARLQPNYYLAVPITSAVIRRNFELFKRKVCSGNYVKNLSGKLLEETFQCGDRLHITIGMLKVFSEPDKLNVHRHLKTCNETIFEPFLRSCNGPLTFNVTGIDSFTDDPTSVRVVFGRIVNDRLQTLLETVRDFFRDRGLIADDVAGHDHLQMHMTVMNTKYLQNDLPAAVADSEQYGANKMPRVLIDCQQLFREFADFDFGTETVTQIQLVPRIHLNRF